MFNLKKHQIPHQQKPPTNNILLMQELNHFGIIVADDKFKITIGDEDVICSSLSECVNHIKDAIQELKQIIWEAWHDISNLSELIISHKDKNQPSLDNIIFLNAVKKSYLLSSNFCNLNDISQKIKNIFNTNPTHVNEELIHKFNAKYIEIKILHYLIMQEIYRKKLIQQININKTAQVSGPWANLDLPMAERVWPFEEDEEYFNDRTRDRKNQTRYNPESNSHGFYYVWPEPTRDPYSFDEFLEGDQPYKSRHVLQIP